MPKGKTKEPDMSPPDTVASEKLFPVVLNKNYCPSGKYEIVGWLRPKVEVKDSAGKMITTEPEKFIEGEMRPAPYPGTGFPNKIWAGTTIRLPVDEAKMVVAKKIADRADVIAA